MVKRGGPQSKFSMTKYMSFFTFQVKDFKGNRQTRRMKKGEEDNVLARPKEKNMKGSEGRMKGTYIEPDTP